MLFKSLDRYRDLGLLLLRVGVGGTMAIFHGWGKIIGGPERWADLGGVMGLIGLDFLPAFWGFMAAIAEFGGGLFVALGLVFRPSLFLLVCTMGMAATLHIKTGDGSPESALIFGCVFLSLMLIGPGKYSLDEMFG